MTETPDLSRRDFGPYIPFFRKRTTIRAVQILGGPFTVQTKEGTMMGKDGDYIAFGVEGERYIIDREIFRKTYEPTGPMGFVPLPEVKVWDFMKCLFHFDNPLVSLARSDSARLTLFHCLEGSCLNWTTIPDEYIRILQDLYLNPPRDESTTWRVGSKTTNDVEIFLSYLEKEFGFVLTEEYKKHVLRPIQKRKKRLAEEIEKSTRDAYKE